MQWSSFSPSRRFIVSKIKSPDEKKKLSYAHDRRNTYGENQKSSRKNIPRSKQGAHQEERRSARQILASAQGSINDDVADQAQSKSMTYGQVKRLKSFRKTPDSPLKEVVERRLYVRKLKASKETDPRI